MAEGVVRLFPAIAGESAAVSAPEAERMVEALLFASPEPLASAELSARLPAGIDVEAVLEALRQTYAGRGVRLARTAGRWAFRTAPDLAWLLSRDRVEPRRLSRAAMETLAIVAYHQPVTRAEIEEIRGVSTNRGTLDVLLESGWVRLRGRRRTPGRPVTYGVTPAFVDHFGLDSLGDLPGIDELKAAGLLDAAIAPGPAPDGERDLDRLAPDEDPLDPGDAAAAAGAEGAPRSPGDPAPAD